MSSYPLEWETACSKQEIITFGRANQLEFLNFFFSLPPEKMMSQIYDWVEILSAIFGVFIHLHPRFQSNRLAILEHTFRYFARRHEDLLNACPTEGTAA